MRHVVHLAALFITAQAYGTSEALACPDCPTARVVRASVFDDNFWKNLALISLPLVVLSVISALLYRIGRIGRIGTKT